MHRKWKKLIVLKQFFSLEYVTLRNRGIEGVSFRLFQKYSCQVAQNRRPICNELQQYDMNMAYITIYTVVTLEKHEEVFNT